MTLPIGSSTGFNPLKGQLLPERYATESFVRNQRIAGAALVAIGFLAGLLGPATLGASFALAAPIVFVGQILFGATLIQQAVGMQWDARKVRLSALQRVFSSCLAAPSAGLSAACSGCSPTAIIAEFKCDFARTRRRCRLLVLKINAGRKDRAIQAQVACAADMIIVEIAMVLPAQLKSWREATSAHFCPYSES